MKRMEEEKDNGSSNGGANTDAPASQAQDGAAAPAPAADAASAAPSAADQERQPSPAERMAETAQRADDASKSDAEAGADDGEHGTGSDVAGVTLTGAAHPEIESGNLNPEAIEDAELRTPLHGTAPGDILDKIRLCINRFEHAVAIDAREISTEVHAEMTSLVDELRGHFHKAPHD